MKKINKKGFVMAETIVASSFVLTVMVILFVQFKSSINSYNRSFNYNKPENISSLGVIKRYLKDNSFSFSLVDVSPYYVSLVYNNKCLDIMNSLDSCDTLVDGAGLQNLILVSTDNYNNLKKEAQNGQLNNVSENMRDFIKDNNLKDEDEANYRLIGEFRDNDSNKSNDPIASISFYITSSKIINIGTTYEYNYTGDYQTFTAPANGIYQLEVWGASGGGNINQTDNSHMGYGGYAIGTLSLNKGQRLYIFVGGQGQRANRKTIGGGYNGGGDGSTWTNGDNASNGSGGGGMTHISTTNNPVVSSNNWNPSGLIIAAGGGGGTDDYLEGTDDGSGGSGGGYIGNSDPTCGCKGGTQSTGYKQGQGQAATSSGDAGGAGGGYYGGTTFQSHNNCGGAGGSGYIGSSILSDKHMTCFNCQTSDDQNTKTISTTNYSSNATSDYAKRGSGYAKIKFLG